MAKITLGKRPETITPEKPLCFRLQDGQEGEMVVTLKYHDRLQFAAMWDDYLKRPEETVGIASAVGARIDAEVDFAGKVLASWDLDGELNAVNLRALAIAEPAFPSALFEYARRAYLEGALGN